MSEKMPAKVGDTLTLTAPMTILITEHESAAYPRGSVLTVTEEWLKVSRDRHGESYLDDLRPEAQMARWGAQKFVFGDESDQILWWNQTPGDGSWNLARDMEAERISKLPTAEERAAATEKARETFGRKNQTTVLSSWGTQR